MFLSRSQIDHDLLKTRLSRTRPMTTLDQQRQAAASTDMERINENWIPMWIDWGHSVTSDCGTICATRGISLDGVLMWLVHKEGKRRGYHAEGANPSAAIAEAKAAWSHRRMVRQEWSQVKAVARDLVLGRLSFMVSREDAYTAPLCRAGVDGFMARIGMANVKLINGRTAALLMIFEPQLGFVIREAYRRHKRAERSRVSGKIIPAQ